MVPLVLFVTLWFVTPDYLPILLEDEGGKKMIMYGFFSSVVGILWIRRILRIDV
jgi:tight adherence protein B